MAISNDRRLLHRPLTNNKP